MKKLLFIDRDGTLISEPQDQQVDSLEKLEFYPGVITWLGKIVREMDYELVMVTNQDGLGTPSFPEAAFWPVQNKLIQVFSNEGIAFSDVFIDKSFAHENKPTRKPGTAMLEKYFDVKYDLKKSFVIGDRLSDIELANNLGAFGILLNPLLKSEIENAAFASTCKLITGSWEEVYKFLTAQRTVVVSRKTNETDVTVNLNLDGSGMSSIATGIGFFNHMLEQLARHSQCDIEISVKGDLHVDEHHTVEDTALALGEAFTQALGNKRGLARYGFCLPMDDCLAQVAIDFGGRPWLVWSAEFKREKIGEMPTEMFMHFFKSFSDAARCNLTIQAEGTNEHHKIESIFKAFARAIKMGIKKEGNELPTTKGTL